MNAKVGFNEVQAYAKMHNVDFKTAAQKLGLSAKEAEALEQLGGDPGAPVDGFQKKTYTFQGRTVEREKTVTLKSGRKVEVFKDVNTGEHVFQYRSADGKIVNEEHFLKQEGLSGRHFALNGKGQLVTVSNSEKDSVQEEKGFFAKAWNKIKQDVADYGKNFTEAWNNSEGALETTGAVIGAVTKTATDIVEDAAENVEKGVSEVTGSELAGKVAKYAAGVGIAAEAVKAVDQFGDWSADRIREAAKNYSGADRQLLETFADSVEDMNAADIALIFAGGAGVAKFAKELPKILNLLKGAGAAGMAGKIATLGVAGAGVMSLTSCSDDIPVLPEKLENSNTTIVNISMSDQKALIEAYNKGIDALLAKIDEISQRLDNMGITLEEFKDQVIQLLTQNNMYLQDISNSLKEQGYKQDEIIEILTNINSTVQTIESLVESTNENITIQGESLKNKLNEILDAIKSGQADSMAALDVYMDELRNMLTDVIQNQQDQIYLEEQNGMTLEEILAQLDNMQGTTSEKLTLMLEILQSIESIGMEISDKLDVVIGKFDEVFKGQQDVLDALAKIEAYVKLNGEKIDVTNNMLNKLYTLMESGVNKEDLEAAIAAILKSITENSDMIGDKIDETNNLIEAIGKVSIELQDKLIKFLAKVGAEFSGILNKILNATINNGNQLELVNQMLAKIDNRDEKFQQQVLDLLNKAGVDDAAMLKELQMINQMLAKMDDRDEKFQTAALEILNNLDAKEIPDYTEILNKILDAAGNNGAKLDAIGELLAKMQNQDAEFQKSVLGVLNDINSKEIPDYTEILNKILESAGSNSSKLDSIAQLLAKIQGQGEQFEKNILDALNKLGIDISADLGDIVTAIKVSSEGSAEIKALLDKVLEAINNNTNVSNSNAKAILDAIANIKITGGDVDLSSIEKMLSELLTLTSKNNGLLESIDAKVEVISVTQQAILDKINTFENKGCDTSKLESLMQQILDKMEQQSGKYDDTKLLEILNKLSAKFDEYSNMTKSQLDELLAAIKDHDVKVTVDVKGKVTCECDCGKSHEGILGDLDDILG